MLLLVILLLFYSISCNTNNVDKLYIISYSNVNPSYYNIIKNISNNNIVDGHDISTIISTFNNNNDRILLMIDHPLDILLSGYINNRQCGTSNWINMPLNSNSDIPHISKHFPLLIDKNSMSYCQWLQNHSEEKGMDIEIMRQLSDVENGLGKLLKDLSIKEMYSDTMTNNIFISCPSLRLKETSKLMKFIKPWIAGNSGIDTFLYSNISNSNRNILCSYRGIEKLASIATNIIMKHLPSELIATFPCPSSLYDIISSSSDFIYYNITAKPNDKTILPPHSNTNYSCQLSNSCSNIRRVASLDMYAYHKGGSVKLHGIHTALCKEVKLAGGQCNASIYTSQSIKQAYNMPLRSNFLMAARHPVDMLLSGYLYHRACHENYWTDVPLTVNKAILHMPLDFPLRGGNLTYCRWLRTHSEAEGLDMEMQRMLWEPNGFGKMLRDRLLLTLNPCAIEGSNVFFSCMGVADMEADQLLDFISPWLPSKEPYSIETVDHGNHGTDHGEQERLVPLAVQAVLTHLPVELVVSFPCSSRFYTTISKMS